MLAVSGALAVGLGGRDVAANMLRDAYDSTRDGRGPIRREVRSERDRVGT
jgi:hypothetical protein